MKGLTKSFKLKSGVTGVYWAPTNAHVHCESNQIEVRMELFHSKLEYENGAASMGEARNVVLTLPVEICDAIDNLMGAVQLQDANSSGQENHPEPDQRVPGFFADSIITNPTPEAPAKTATPKP